MNIEPNTRIDGPGIAGECRASVFRTTAVFKDCEHEFFEPGLRVTPDTPNHSETPKSSPQPLDPTERSDDPWELYCRIMAEPYFKREVISDALNRAREHGRQEERKKYDPITGGPKDAG